MAHRTKTDVVQMIHDFQKTVLDQQPSYEDMVSDVRMMRFRVRPVEGDIMKLNFGNTEFVEILWSLGKLDEFFQYVAPTLSKKEKDVFNTLFDRLYQNYQRKLHHINLRGSSADADDERKAHRYELEIYRDKRVKRN